MKELELFPLFNLEGGVNTRFSLHALLENEAADMQNFHLEARGGIEKRGGYSPHVTADTATTDPTNGLWQHRGESTNFTLRVEGGTISSTTGSSWTDITSGETISSDEDDLVKAEVFRGYSIFTDGVNPILKWSGSGGAAKATQIFTGSDTIDSAYTLVRHRERIVLGDVNTTESSTPIHYESGLWGATAGTLDTWINPGAADGFLELGKGDGDSITNLQDIQGFLIAFKQRSFFRVSEFGSANVTSLKVSGSVGCPGKHAAIVVGKHVYFLDSIGRFWRYDATQGDNPDALDELSRDKLGVSTTNRYVRSRLPFAFLYHNPSRDEIMCFMTEDAGTETNVAWVYNIVTGGFVPHRHADNFNIGCQAIDAQKNPTFLAGTYEGLVQEFDDTLLTDDGETITAYVTLRHVDDGNLAIEKIYYWLHMYTRCSETQTLTVEHFHDFAEAGDTYNVAVSGGGDLLDSTFILDTSTLSGPGEKMTRVKIKGYDRWTQIKVSQAEDQELKILGFLIYFKPSDIHIGPLD